MLWASWPPSPPRGPPNTVPPNGEPREVGRGGLVWGLGPRTAAPAWDEARWAEARLPAPSRSPSLPPCLLSESPYHGWAPWAQPWQWHREPCQRCQAPRALPDPPPPYPAQPRVSGDRGTGEARGTEMGLQRVAGRRWGPPCSLPAREGPCPWWFPPSWCPGIAPGRGLEQWRRQGRLCQRRTAQRQWQSCTWTVLVPRPGSCEAMLPTRLGLCRCSFPPIPPLRHPADPLPLPAGCLPFCSNPRLSLQLRGDLPLPRPHQGLSSPEIYGGRRPKPADHG